MYKACRSIAAALCLSSALLILHSGAIHAQTTADLYAATVPVAEQSNAELHRAATIGLREVLVRISGQSDIARSPALGNALNDAERYLDQYRYERANSNEPGALPWSARLRFSQNNVAQLLRGAGLPLWTGSRPILQVWLVADDGRGRQFVGEQAPLAAALREQAQRRGLALQFPNSFSAATLDDVWQLDASKLQATVPAGTVLLVGRVAQVAGGRWLGAWALPTNAQTGQTIEGDGDNLAAYLVPSIDRVADTLGRQYAVVAGAAGSAGSADGVVLRVGGIENFNDYAALLAYLRQLGAIKAANPLQVRGGEILLQIKLAGSAEQLARQLALDNRLASEPAIDTGAATTGPLVLSYRWQAARG
jgi:hypothetical protein